MSGTLHSFIQLAWRNMWRNPRRTLITLVVVSAGLWSILFFNAFLNAWMQSSKDATLKLLIGSGQIHAREYMDNPNIKTVMAPPGARLRAALERPEIAAWSARLVLPGVIQSEYKTRPVNIAGVDPATERRLSSIPAKIVRGRYLNGVDDDGVVLGLHMAKRLKTGLGRRVILMSQNADGTVSEQSFTVVGLFDANQKTEDFYVFTGRAADQRFLHLNAEISEIAFAVPNDADLDPVLTRLRAAAPQLDVRSWRQLSTYLAATDSMMRGVIYIWLAVVFSMMAIGIVNTQLMAVFERLHEFGLLRALGMTPRRVLMMVSLESLFLIGVGCLVGMALAALTIWGLRGGIDLSAFAKGLELVQGGQVLFPKFDLASFVVFPLLIWLLGILVALWPASRAAKASPVEAMRHAT